MAAIMQSLKRHVSPSTLKLLRELNYQVHLARQRVANRLIPSRVRARTKLRQDSDIKLHWGCGSRRLDGWVNVDGWRSEATDYVHDLRTQLPFRALTVELIFTEHVLEHVEFDVAEKVLADFHRILRPGGKVRLVVPDLEKCCRAYLNDDAVWFAKVDAQRLTAGDGLNHIFYSHFHRYIYDSKTLALLLHKVGFARVTKSCHLGSTDERLRIDTDSECRSLVSLYMEAEKC